MESATELRWEGRDDFELELSSVLPCAAKLVWLAGKSLINTAGSAGTAGAVFWVVFVCLNKTEEGTQKQQLSEDCVTEQLLEVRQRSCWVVIEAAS